MSSYSDEVVGVRLGQYLFIYCDHRKLRDRQSVKVSAPQQLLHGITISNVSSQRRKKLWRIQTRLNEWKLWRI